MGIRILAIYLCCFESVYESNPRKPKFEIDGEEEEDDDGVEEEVSDFGRKTFGLLVRPI